MTRLRLLAFWALAIALLCAHVVVVWHSLTARFWEDEAFNLTVPLNLLAGLGYSSDGALSGSAITPFDPRISTGPSVLLPVTAVLAFGVDPVIGARMVPVAYWGLLVAGLVVLGTRLAGRWVGLLAGAAPLAFNGLGSYSPIQGPADLLGEIPAAALLVWALVVLPRRAWLAGLLVGLAVQAKLIALLALPAFAVAMFVLAPGRGWQKLWETVKRGWLPLVLAGVPTLLLELWALVALGPSGFRDHLRGMRDFVRGGGQRVEPTTVTQKLDTLAAAWFVPGWLIIVVALVCAAVAVAGLVVGWRGVRDSASGDVAGSAESTESAESERPSSRPAGRGSWRLALMLGCAALVGALTFVGWWSTASHTPLWVRHPAPGVLAFFPVLAIVALWGVRVLWSRGLALRVVAAGASVVIVGSATLSVAGHVAATSTPRGETLETQRAAVEPIRQWVQETGTEWLAAHPWGAAVSPVVMSGAHVGLSDAANMRGVPRVTGQACDTEVLVEGPRYRVCAAP
ncbi:hypothetical protein [Microbacterium sp.]|uniref:hypothetical protein n=1 Tax=Microbacterium sp. TaxID=51671 RepID=UPI0028116A9B|nr:hypothetical protein [Microbacterium sp.]